MLMVLFVRMLRKPIRVKNARPLLCCIKCSSQGVLTLPESLYFERILCQTRKIFAAILRCQTLQGISLAALCRLVCQQKSHGNFANFIPQQFLTAA
jgi:hypothetical protein